MNKAGACGRTIFCLFTRLPEPGKVKTRLIPALGTEGAATLHREMTEHVLGVLHTAAGPLQAHIEVRFTGADEASVRQWLGSEVSCAAQGEGDLGVRMSRAAEEHFAAGAARVLIVGGDCPEMDKEYLADARALLERHRCVIGPAMDGGYCLVGLTEALPEIFTGIDWGTERVLDQTISAFKAVRRAHGNSRPFPGILPALPDVDRPEDVPPLISVIIPALNEEHVISRTVADVLSAFGTECIVVDGGSADATRQKAKEAGARVLSCPPGRARQMNSGAEEANGGIFLFLHADSRLPSGWTREIRRALKRTKGIVGAFSFKLDDPCRKARWVEWGARLRCRLFRLPYGDQGFFMTGALFRQLGGFPEQPVLEDAALVRRARAAKIPVRCLDLPLATSARRWRKLGYARTSFLNQCVLLAHRLGVPPERIRTSYLQGQNPLWALLPGKGREVSSS